MIVGSAANCPESLSGINNYAAGFQDGISFGKREIMVKAARIICIGKIRTAYWKDACSHYLKLLRNFRNIEITELRDAQGSLNWMERNEIEGARILSSLRESDLSIALSENGKILDSFQFAALLKNCDEHLQKRPTFIIGGPYGLSQAIFFACNEKISLSAMTFPHELARVLLLEQLFRAESILRNTPYHH